MFCEKSWLYPVAACGDDRRPTVIGVCELVSGSVIWHDGDREGCR